MRLDFFNKDVTRHDILGERVEHDQRKVYCKKKGCRTRINGYRLAKGNKYCEVHKGLEFNDLVKKDKEQVKRASDYWKEKRVRDRKL